MIAGVILAVRLAYYRRALRDLWLRAPWHSDVPMLALKVRELEARRKAHQ